MSSYDNQYLDLVEEILNEGIEAPCRTGNNTLVKLNRVLTHDLKDGFPILTFRPLPFKGMKAELAMFLQGNVSKESYQKSGCLYWNDWCNPQKVPYSDKEGMKKENDLGPIYGWQWRFWNAEYVDEKTDYTGQGYDQLKRVVDTLKTNPYDRRLIINAWNPSYEDKMALPPCVFQFQFNYLDNRLHITVNQRSCDTLLGVPTDFQFYALLLHLMCQTVDMKPGTITLNLCNCHIYDNHIEKTKENMKRWREVQYNLPKLVLDPSATVFNFMPDMASLENYQHGEKVTFPIAV